MIKINLNLYLNILNLHHTTYASGLRLLACWLVLLDVLIQSSHFCRSLSFCYLSAVSSVLFITVAKSHFAICSRRPFLVVQSYLSIMYTLKIAFSLLLDSAKSGRFNLLLNIGSKNGKVPE